MEQAINLLLTIIMTRWVIKNRIKPQNLDLSNNLPDIILSLLFSRGICEKKEIELFFNSNYETDLIEPKKIMNLDLAVRRIIEAGKKNQKIAIFGDYDADGVTASALLYEALLDLGFNNLISYIPDRQLEGYGINESAIKYLKQNKVDLIITVDCGITNAKEIEIASKMGIDVIITDHHHIPAKLPRALAIINPHLKNSGFKFQKIAGVGVAFKLAQALYQKIDPKRINQLKWFLDLVCIGTIADCVPLLHENRILVKYGLLVLGKTRRIGLQEMIKVGRMEINENNIPDAQKVAFQISPRINAAGRMDHANISYNLILEKNRIRARELALEIETKNQERQKITNEIFREVKILANNSFRNKKIIFAQNPHWPIGVLGLVAGKICEEFGKPTIILKKQEDEYIGSLRSIPELDIMKILQECDYLLEKYGGHSQAAGITIKKVNIQAFFDKFSFLTEKELANKEISKKIEIDLEIFPSEINWELMKELKKMEPFGEGNKEPVFFMKQMIIIDLRIVGNGNKHLKLSLKGSQDSPKIFDSIGFSMGEKFDTLKTGELIDIVFNLRQDEWNGNKKIQLNLIDLRQSEKI